MNSFIKTATGMTIIVGNKPYNVDNTHPNYILIENAVKEKRYSDIPGLVNISIALKKYARGAVEVDVDKGEIYYNGQILHNCLVDRIFDMMSEGFDVNPMINFLQRLMQNPSKRAVDELYLFLEKGKLPITEDGCFLAYKRVRNDYTDCHTGKVLNKPYDLVTERDIFDLDRLGKCIDDGPWDGYVTERGVTVEFINQETVISMARNAVDDNRDRTCSEGLHFCSHEYLQSFGGARIVIVKIDPADVVSIPSDYSNTKGRACKYVVIGELDEGDRRRAETTNVLNQPVYTYGRDEYQDDMIDWEESSEDMWYQSDDYDTSEDPSDEPEVSEEFIHGYDVGYRDGHKKRKMARNVTTHDGYTSQQARDTNSGYDLGYKHGKSHKKRLYK